MADACEACIRCATGVDSTPLRGLLVLGFLPERAELLAQRLLSGAETIDHFVEFFPFVEQLRKRQRFTAGTTLALHDLARTS